MGNELTVSRPIGFLGGDWKIGLGDKMPSRSDFSKAINRLVTERDGYWGGVPMPLPGLSLQLAPGHPLAEMVAGLQKIVDEDAPKDEAVACADEDLGWRIVNEWRGFRRDGAHGRVMVVRHEDGRTRALFDPSAPRRNRFVFGPFETMDAWDLDAELTAVERLATLLNERMFKAYVLTGQFQETSKRSGIAYIFRRLRPTIALRSGRARHEFFADESGPGTDESSVLACLCLHPLAYYERTFCGAMVPTDDVIAHLLLMRGDEHLYWKRASQHHPLDPESGL